MKPTLQHGELYSRLCGDLNGKEIPKREDTRIHVADSLCHTVETNMTLSSNHTLQKKKEYQDKINTAYFFLMYKGAQNTIWVQEKYLLLLPVLLLMVRLNYYYYQQPITQDIISHGTHFFSGWALQQESFMILSLKTVVNKPESLGNFIT